MFRGATDVYFKGTALMLAIFGAGIGYLFTVSLTPQYARVVCLAVLTVVASWYVCSLWAIRVYNSIMKEINDTARHLALAVDETGYKGFKVILVVGLVGFLPLLGIVLYFLVVPPVDIGTR